jgi:hypothetical protein
MTKHCQELTEAQLQELLVVETPVSDEELSGLTLLDAYRFSDGRILFLFDGEPPSGTLWPSRDSVLQSLVSNAEQEEEHVLAGHLPHGESFPAQVPQLIVDLADALELEPESVDYSDASLVLIDRRVKERYKPADRLSGSVFHCLVAYVGEAVRQRVGGVWEMRKAYRSEVWEPWVRSPNGREFAPFLCVHEQLINHTDESAQLLRAVPAWAREE